MFDLKLSKQGFAMQTIGLVVGFQNSQGLSSVIQTRGISFD